MNSCKFPEIMKDLYLGHLYTGEGPAAASLRFWTEFFMLISIYWNMVHGANPEQIKQDLEGMQVMRVLGNNMAFFLHCKNVALKMGISMPKQEPMVFTNFIR